MPEAQKRHKFLAALLVIILAFLLRFKMGFLAGWEPDFVFAALISLSFYLTFMEFIFLMSLSVLIFSWQPLFGMEIILFVALPLALFFFRKIVYALEGWLSNLVSVLVGLSLFYFIPNLALTVEHLPVFLNNLSVSLIMSAVLFELFRFFYREDAV